MRGNFHAKCPFNNESETILLQLCIEFFAASSKENFIYLDLQKRSQRFNNTNLSAKKEEAEEHSKDLLPAFIPAN